MPVGPSRRNGWLTPITAWRVLVIVNTTMVIVALILASLLFTELRDRAIQSCQNASEPLIAAQIDLLEGEVVRQQAISPALFPDIPREEFRRLTHEQIHDNREQIKVLREIPSCESRF